tara:strand:+ start:736 stop:906 length:171 start_codon:yes stop_codon:yes gene_type:complete
MILGTVVRIGVEMCRSVEMVEKITVVRARDRDRGIKAKGLEVADNWLILKSRFNQI